jgi:hypothetical protein
LFPYRSLYPSMLFRSSTIKMSIHWRLSDE